MPFKAAEKIWDSMALLWVSNAKSAPVLRSAKGIYMTCGGPPSCRCVGGKQTVLAVWGVHPNRQVAAWEYANTTIAMVNSGNLRDKINRNMKRNIVMIVGRNGMRDRAKWIPKGLAVAMMFLHQNATAQLVDFGTASGFAILAGSQITDVPLSSTIVSGDVGLYPATGLAIGLTAGQLQNGTIYTAELNGALLNQAKNDLTTAYVDAGGRPVPAANNFGVVDNQLGGKTLFPGVYSFGHAATANLIGELTLDPGADLNPVWIFLASSDLIVQSESKVTMLGGATPCDVFWWVGSSATIGTYTEFVGNIMADQSIALQTGATLDGSALARIGAVTLDHNTITDRGCAVGGGNSNGNGGGTAVPDSGSTLLLLSSGLVGLLVFKQRRLVTA